VVPVQFDLTNHALKASLTKNGNGNVTKRQLCFGRYTWFSTTLFRLCRILPMEIQCFYSARIFGIISTTKTILSAMISVSLLINAAVLTFFIQKKNDKTAKGIFFTTCIYAVVAIACKWFL